MIIMNKKAAITSAGESGSDRSGSGALFVGGLAAIVASTCCLGPLVLVALGLSGAWIGNLTLLEPYRPFFIASRLERRVDWKPHAARTVPSIFYRRRSGGPVLCRAPHLSASAGLPARCGVRGAKDSPHLQIRVWNCFCTRSRRAGISVCGQAFLLSLDPRRSCYEE